MCEMLEGKTPLFDALLQDKDMVEKMMMRRLPSRPEVTGHERRWSITAWPVAG